MAETFHAERAAFVSMEKTAKQDRARALDAVRLGGPQRQGAPTEAAVTIGRRAWIHTRRRLDALRGLRGR